MAQATRDRRLRPQGHGIGVEIRELPYVRDATAQVIEDGCIRQEADLELRPGFVLNLEVSAFSDGSSIKTEQSFVVTATGSDHLTRQARARPWLRTQERRP
jgi:Xaa-Pro aminopeptidase